MSILDVKNLQVVRSETFCLQIPDLSLAPKTILCVAGPNGSGKTTFIDSLAGLLLPNKGDVYLDGQKVSNDVKATKTIMGFIPDNEAWFVKELCAQEYFALLANIFRQAGVTSDVEGRADALAEALHFTAFKQPLEQLSHGNKKKVQIIAGLMHSPRVIIVDELRNGLDPLAIIAAEQLMRDEAARGACIVAATHDLWWAERIADEILLLIDGSPAVFARKKKIVKQYGSVEQLFMKKVGAQGDHEPV